MGLILMIVALLVGVAVWLARFSMAVPVDDSDDDASVSFDDEVVRLQRKLAADDHQSWAEDLPQYHHDPSIEDDD